MNARFDSVVMLTWSDWKTEPRSNRYHYASRFARSVPVLFVQPDSAAALSEPTELERITLLHVGARYDDEQLAPVASLLAAQGLNRPLLWIYNPNYTGLERHFPGAPRVFHATEDYFSGSTFLHEPAGAARYAHRLQVLGIQRRVILAVRASHLVVCVSHGVAERIARFCGRRRELRVLENGCDYAFWAARPPAATAPSARRVAVYHGGINERLDAALIVGLMRRLPDWEFQFCGSVSPTFDAWREVQGEPNFRYLGTLDPEAMRDVLYRADVGIMPYRRIASVTSTIMPLKAFEYAACGLPVVSVPIDSIASFPQVFRVARSADEFAQAMREEAAQRSDPQRLQARLAAARAQDYDARFRQLEEWLRVLPRSRPSSAPRWMRLAVLAAGELWNRALYRIAGRIATHL